MTIGQLILAIIVGVPYLLAVYLTIEEIIENYKWAKRHNMYNPMGDAFSSLGDKSVFTVIVTLGIIIFTLMITIAYFWQTPL